MPLIAMAFAEWLCAGCRQRVAWVDAVLDEEDGKLFGVSHRSCLGEETP